MSSIDPKEFDTSVKPNDDFFQYVNGKWFEKNPIPPEEAQWGSFSKLRVDVEYQLKAIFDDLVAGKSFVKKDIAQLVGNFYVSGMNVAKRNELGAEPLAPTFALIGAIKDKAELPAVIAQLHQVGAWTWWIPFIDNDAKQSSMMALHLYQGGLGLPDRDYYLGEDEKNVEIRKKYRAHIVGMLKLGGASEADAMVSADVIMKIETALATAARTRVELRDVHKQYNKMTPAELAAISPAIKWAGYFEGMGLPMPEYFIVGQPEFFTAVSKQFETLPLAEIKIYLSWHVLNEAASYLSEDLEKLSFDFYAGTFRGTKEMKAQWRRVLTVVNDLLDEAVGELYVERNFSEDAKKKVNVLVENLMAAFKVHIDALDWMDDATKKKAQEKLAKFSRKLGYPDKWKTWEGLTLAAEDGYAANVMRAHTYEFMRRVKKAGKPVDRTEWLMPPQMVNAYYQPPMNEIVFPAAILQPPFFDPNADDAVNYGGIGSVIGHELSHGFDDQGALFNASGNLENWWTKEDKERFDAKAARLAEHFDRYEPLPGLHVNGKLTLGENIADLGGLVVAYDALLLALKGQPAEPIDELTPAQRFFTSFAICERGMKRDEFLRLVIKTDPHSPSKYRVNGPVSNSDVFYETFGCKPGDGLYRDASDRVKIW